MQAVVERFVHSFQKAVRAEMDALREQQGPFEVAIDSVTALEAPPDSRHAFYDLSVPAPNDKLLLNGECTLVHDHGETLVTIVAIEGHRLGIRCEDELPLTSSAYRLVIYPWFLYERLLQVLGALPQCSRFAAGNALTLFGRLLPRLQPGSASAAIADLNASQQRAVQLCRDSNLAFIWGPPGTGKTRTLGHIVMDLVSRGLRVVVTSTTNAALDQALARLAGLPPARILIDSGGIIRVGQTDAETFGASLPEAIRRQTEILRTDLRRLTERKRALTMQLTDCQQALVRLAAARGLQLDMFAPPQDDALRDTDLARVFGARLRQHVLGLDRDRVRDALDRRARRLEQIRGRCQARIDAHAAILCGKEQAVLRRARVILATMSNLYVSERLRNEEFDAVIVEEAGMAVLPTLFYCAGLGREKVIAVGDPRQLPPIVVSRDPFVRKAMGRSIFDVTVPEPHGNRSVVMLDTQYRMHPLIGKLVSDLFYDGRLRNDAGTAGRDDIARRHPFPGCPLIVVDTGGRTRCRRDDGSYSRYNPETADLCVRLARNAVTDGVGSVAIITPYARQSRLIGDLLAAGGVSREQVECRTVHRFQGNERDLVILDTVDTRPMKPGVLLAGRESGSAAPHLINVSISRAKGKLVIVADVAYFHSEARDSAIDRVLTAAAAAGKRIGQELLATAE